MKKRHLRWWVFWSLWAVAGPVALVYPFLRTPDYGTGGLVLLISTFACLFGVPTYVITLTNWRELTVLQRFLGIVPVVFFIAPVFLAALLVVRLSLFL